MLNRKWTWPGLLIGGLILPGIVAHADEFPEDLTGAWSLSVTMGASNWNGLKKLEPARGGGFDSTGLGLEFAAHTQVKRWGPANVLIGIDLGAFATESNIPGYIEDLTQRALYLTPSMKVRFGERRSNHLNLEAGLGWYNMDIAEIVDLNLELAVPFDKDAFGGYLGVSGGFGGWFIMGLKVHFADFGQVTGLGPDTGDLSGPIVIFSLGGAFGS